MKLWCDERQKLTNLYQLQFPFFLFIEHIIDKIRSNKINLSIQ